MDVPDRDPWSNEEFVTISAIEHWSYCPRQCALIHLEQTFDDNLYTLRGRVAHERTDEPDWENKAGVRVEHALPLWSQRLGLVGRGDVVEFHGRTPYPVEHKSGPRRRWGHEELQLCAQALCLEEMTAEDVPRGAIYYHGSRRRREVLLDHDLRRQTEAAVQEIRKMMNNHRLPPPVNDTRCRSCSLIDSCLPSVVAEASRLQGALAGLFKTIDP